MPTLPSFGGKTLQEAATIRTNAGFSGGTYTASADEGLPVTHKITLQLPAPNTTQAATCDIAVYVRESQAELDEEAVYWGT